MSFLQRFQTVLELLCPELEKTQFVIAYSGGVDSHVLLHCCHQINLPIRAVHIHHGLQSVADDWTLHCQKICDELSIQLAIIYVDATKKARQSPEESARLERYAALQKNLQQGEILLTGQHLNDQAETFLLQLFRTASSAGLAAMPVSRRLADNYHIRPLLDFSRHDIEHYAIGNSLCWIEDPSNIEDRFDRNYIRNKLIPSLEVRWPACVEQLVTVAELQFSNLQVMEDMAAIDLAQAVIVPEQLSVKSCLVATRYDVVSVLSISVLKKLSTPRLLNVLRYWIKQTDFCESEINPVSAGSVSRNLLLEIEKTIIHSQQDANPVIEFSGDEYRKYQNNIYRLKYHLKQKSSISSQAKDLHWNPSDELYLPSLNCTIGVVACSKGGLKKHLLDEKLKISFRQGGEQFHPVNRKHSQSLKKLYQEANIPPWERDAIPLLYWQDELIAVVGFWVSKHHSAGVDDTGWQVELKAGCLNSNIDQV